MLLCMRTTIDIHDELLRLAKRRAADEGTTLRAVVEAALRTHLGLRTSASRYRLRWKKPRGRLRPGFPIDDRAAMYDLLDGPP
jgi:Arc/MetJ family transcription regulator